MELILPVKRKLLDDLPRIRWMFGPYPVYPDGFEVIYIEIMNYYTTSTVQVLTMRFRLRILQINRDHLFKFKGCLGYIDFR